MKVKTFIITFKNEVLKSYFALTKPNYMTEGPNII